VGREGEGLTYGGEGKGGGRGGSRGEEKGEVVPSNVRDVLTPLRMNVGYKGY